MFHDKCWKPIYFGISKSKVKVTSHETIAGVSLYTLVSAGFFYFLLLLCYVHCHGRLLHEANTTTRALVNQT